MSTIPTQELTVRYFAGAAAAAGREEETFEVPAGATVQQLAELLGRRHGPALLPVLAVSSFLVDAVRTDRQSALPQDARHLDVLPPFAGG